MSVKIGMEFFQLPKKNFETRTITTIGIDNRKGRKPMQTSVAIEILQKMIAVENTTSEMFDAIHLAIKALLLCLGKGLKPQEAVKNDYAKFLEQIMGDENTVEIMKEAS